MFSYKFTEKAQEALTIAQSKLSELNHTELDLIHIIFGLLEQRLVHRNGCLDSFHRVIPSFWLIA